MSQRRENDGSAAAQAGEPRGRAALPTAPVTSVYGRTGVVVALAGDYTATQVGNTATGTIAATDVQAAINELDTEKLALAGGTMTGSINMGSNVISNVGTPVAGTDATTKSYVDARTPFDTEAIGTDIGNRVNNDILMFHGGLYDNHTVTGDVVFTSNGSNVATAAISSEVIVNGDVSPTAGIIQSKLDMQAASTRANASGIAQSDLGLAAFDSGDFAVTDGWVTLAASAVDFADLPDIAQNTVFARSASGTGDASAISFADIVNTGGSFTTTGVADRIVKTGADGSIDAQKFKLDNYDILDQTNLTMTMKTPGGATVLSTVGTVPSNTTTTTQW